MGPTKVGSLIEANTTHFHHHSKGGQHETNDEGEAEDDELQQHGQSSDRHELSYNTCQAQHQTQATLRFGQR